MADARLSETEKARRIQALVSGREVATAYNAHDNAGSAKDSRCASSAFCVSYSDKAQKILGCPHYRRKAKLLAPCCNEWVSCRFCHDESKQHTLNRFDVERMRCMRCLKEQPIGRRCVGCRLEMGRYYCHTCRLIDDGPDKHIFHCDRCGICLSGRRSDYYHCDVCDACVAVDARKKHSCKEKRLQCTCPICGEQLAGSALNIVQPSCEHLVHESCLNKHLEHSYKCPVCMASLCDTQSIFESIDCYMRLSVMPLEYKDKLSLVFCNDCHNRSEA
ncbi:hypothetical protein H4R26_005334, partial [Coemansia thaxteri]